MTIDQTIALFESEFSPLLGKFELYVLSHDEAKNLKDDFVWKPGCYVHWSPDHEVVKVGVSLDNSRKRALQHFHSDYGDDGKNAIIESLKENDGSRIILFNVRNESDRHWAAATEIFLEGNLDPAISAGRIG